MQVSISRFDESKTVRGKRENIFRLFVCIFEYTGNRTIPAVAQNHNRRFNLVSLPENLAFKLFCKSDIGILEYFSCTFNIRRKHNIVITLSLIHCHETISMSRQNTRLKIAITDVYDNSPYLVSHAAMRLRAQHSTFVKGNFK